MADEKIKKREIQSLVDAREELGADSLVVLTENDEGKESVGNIKIEIIPLWKWLISSEDIQIKLS
ncbi:MAG: hypothetical protein AB1595_04175 [bacterium]